MTARAHHLQPTRPRRRPTQPTGRTARQTGLLAWAKIQPSRPAPTVSQQRIGKGLNAVLAVGLLAWLIDRDGLGAWLWVAAATSAVAWAPTWIQRTRYTRDAYQRTRRICRDEEWAADRAQNRRHWLRLLRGALGRHTTGVFLEPVRRPTRPSKYVRIRFAPDAGWWPRRRHVAQITRRWAREWEPKSATGGLDKVKAQLEAFLDGRALDAEVSLKHCRAVFTPTTPKPAKQDAASADGLPERLLYPDQPREAS